MFAPLLQSTDGRGVCSNTSRVDGKGETIVQFDGLFDSLQHGRRPCKAPMPKDGKGHTMTDAA